MKKGDKAILVNHSRLVDCGMVKCEGKTVTLLRPEKNSTCRWWVNVSDPPGDWHPTTDYWVFTECIQLVTPGPQYRTWSEGEEAVLVNIETLRDVSLGGNFGKTVTLKRRMTQDEKENRSYARRYLEEDVWWILIPFTSGDFYVPARCLSKPQLNHQPSVDAYASNEPFRITLKEKEKDSMTMYQVAIVLKPSVVAQQAGAVDKIIVQPTTVMALSDNGAVAQVSAENSMAILALKDEMASLSVCVKRFADC